MVSISACHAEDPGSIPGRGVLSLCFLTFCAGWNLLITWRARVKKKSVTLLDLCVSSLRRGRANLLCIVPILTDDLRRESDREWFLYRRVAGLQLCWSGEGPMQTVGTRRPQGAARSIYTYIRSAIV